MAEHGLAMNAQAVVETLWLPVPESQPQILFALHVGSLGLMMKWIFVLYAKIPRKLTECPYVLDAMIQSSVKIRVRNWWKLRMMHKMGHALGI